MNTAVKTRVVGQQEEMRERDVFSTVLIHCLAIILAPIFTFFVCNFWIFNSLGFEPMSSNIASALLAVIALHVALANLIYRAYFTTETIQFDKLDKED